MNYKGDPNKYAIWNIYGEDPNCDMGGSHINPFLGQAEGRYCDVLEYAKTLQGWYQWGGGGYISENKQLNIKKVASSSISHERYEKIKSLNLDGFKYTTDEIAKIVQKAVQAVVKSDKIKIEMRGDSEIILSYSGDDTHGSQKFSIKVEQVK